MLSLREDIRFFFLSTSSCAATSAIRSPSAVVLFCYTVVRGEAVCYALFLSGHSDQSILERNSVCTVLRCVFLVGRLLLWRSYSRSSPIQARRVPASSSVNSPS